MLIEPNNPTVGQTSRRFWEDELENSRIMLADVNDRIHALEIESYTLDTGQTNQAVRRSGLEALITARMRLLKDITEIEALLGLGIPPWTQCIQVGMW
jgi:hypothetical protein